ncbi:hypothetical protein [Saccharothrix sp. Mg75]|uniref:hypothetical protein n=1 Tax=Saccharothrix sp. Mg75 TaxID=3445357 RepID=UPI003EE85A3D
MHHHPTAATPPRTYYAAVTRTVLTALGTTRPTAPTAVVVEELATVEELREAVEGQGHAGGTTAPAEQAASPGERHLHAIDLQGEDESG